MSKKFSKTHRCVVAGCQIQVPNRYLMCAPHWHQVPTVQKRIIEDLRTPGQEKNPRLISRNYFLAVHRATELVKQSKGALA
jgi:hypothetical protein